VASNEFDEPRLAAIYDVGDGPRDDLDLYEDVAREFGATSVLDVGCGTGDLALRLAARSLAVVAVDPAAAMLAVARSKPHAERVRWVHGDLTALERLQVDMATMTGNVAQVFLADDDWTGALRSIAGTVRPGGHVVFETRDPAQRAWEDWTRDRTHHRLETPATSRSGARSLRPWGRSSASAEPTSSSPTGRR
jgi:ubiquinone/menaquinone biosynthesis C-methylase UbiE